MKLEKQIENIERITNKNIKLYGDMEKELEAETEALKAHLLPDIEAVVKRKMQVAHEIKALESDRLKSLELLSEQINIPVKEVSLSRLAQIVGGETGGRLLELKVKLRDIVESVTGKNMFNQGIIERLMKLNYDSASHLKELIEPEETYKKSGTNELSLKVGHVVSKKM